jgi:hypothetical protein
MRKTKRESFIRFLSALLSTSQELPVYPNVG